MKKGIMATRSIMFILSKRKLENLDIFSLSLKHEDALPHLFLFGQTISFMTYSNVKNVAAILQWESYKTKLSSAMRTFKWHEGNSILKRFTYPQAEWHPVASA